MQECTNSRFITIFMCYKRKGRKQRDKREKGKKRKRKIANARNEFRVYIVNKRSCDGFCRNICFDTYNYRNNDVVYIKPLICSIKIFKIAGSLRIFYFLKSHFFSNSILCFLGVKYFAIINNRAKY